MKILVTGASGFVGRHAVARLRQKAHDVVPGVRRASGFAGEIVTGEIDGNTDWSRALDGIEAVIHCAAVSQGDFIRTNRDGSANLAAAAAGRVRHFVHVSTIKVLGETTPHPLDETAPFNPADLYGRSKAEAEIAVRQALEGSSTSLTIIRPPLVYGKGGHGNFERLAALVRRGVPLPFGAIRNRRSLIHVDNLCHVLARALESEAGLYHVSDGQDISTPQWVRLAAAAQHVPARLFDVPPPILEFALLAFGRSGLARRLTRDLAFDCRKAQAILGPMPLSIEQGFARTLI